MPVKYVFIGDSLTAECSWKWKLAANPLSIVNLASGGADLRSIAHQADAARSFHPEYLLISGGINDLLFDQAPLDQIEYDIRFLLRRVAPGQNAIITLIPYVSDRRQASRIAAANAAISGIVSQRGIPIVDLNSSLSENGVRKPEMTTDGIHFTPLACNIWIDAMRAQLNIGRPTAVNAQQTSDPRHNGS
jgi:lysophospholipase L1-like esterase